MRLDATAPFPGHKVAAAVNLTTPLVPMSTINSPSLFLELTEIQH